MTDEDPPRGLLIGRDGRTSIENESHFYLENDSQTDDHFHVEKLVTNVGLRVTRC